MKPSSELGLSQSEGANLSTFVVDNLLRSTIKVQPTIDDCIGVQLELIEEGKSEADIDISNHCVAKALSVSQLSTRTGFIK